jgi:hypothetical protein
MSSIEEILDKALGPEEGVVEMPVVAHKLIGWFENMKKRSKGTFDFKTEKDEKTGNVHIALTFKEGPSHESKVKVEIVVNGSVLLDGESYTGHGTYSRNGLEWHYNKQDDVIKEVVTEIADRIKECKKAVVSNSPEPALAQETAPAPVIRRGLRAGP